MTDVREPPDSRFSGGRTASIVAAILADTDPAMKYATDFPILRKRIRVTLDGEDVTRRCRGFSIPLQRVELFVEEPGRLNATRKVMAWTCACGTTTKRGATWRR